MTIVICQCSFIIPVGCLFSTILVLFSYIWLLYCFHLTLKLIFPLKSAKISNSNHNKAIYIAEVSIVSIIAAIPSSVGIGLSKYRINTYPPVFCHSDRTYHFYTVVVPILTGACLCQNLMLFLLYKLHIVSLAGCYVRS